MSKILIIDDEAQIRSLLARMMELEGYEVCQAGDCKSALKQLELHSPDVALCCLLYTSDAADDLLCVDLGGRRIIQKKKKDKKKKKTTRYDR